MGLPADFAGGGNQRVALVGVICAVSGDFTERLAGGPASPVLSIISWPSATRKVLGDSTCTAEHNLLRTVGQKPCLSFSPQSSNSEVRAELSIRQNTGECQWRHERRSARFHQSLNCGSSSNISLLAIKVRPLHGAPRSRTRDDPDDVRVTLSSRRGTGCLDEPTRIRVRGFSRWTTQQWTDREIWKPLDRHSAGGHCQIVLTESTPEASERLTTTD